MNPALPPGRPVGDGGSPGRSEEGCESQNPPDTEFAKKATFKVISSLRPDNTCLTHVGANAASKGPLFPRLPPRMTCKSGCWTPQRRLRAATCGGRTMSAGHTQVERTPELRPRGTVEAHEDHCEDCALIPGRPARVHGLLATRQASMGGSAGQQPGCRGESAHGVRAGCLPLAAHPLLAALGTWAFLVQRERSGPGGAGEQE